jgi:isopenicillin-N N-acyltransferase-like protein
MFDLIDIEGQAHDRGRQHGARAAASQRDISRDTLSAIFRDHAHGAYAICCHPEPSEPALEQTATRASVIMDLEARTLHLTAGRPCRHEYQPYTLGPALT